MNEEKNFCFRNLKTFKSVTQNLTGSSEIQVLRGPLDQALASLLLIGMETIILKIQISSMADPRQ